MNSPAMPALWKVWRNPIVRRYATARLRPGSLLMWGIPVEAAGGFFWLVTFLYLYKYAGQTVQDSARAAWTPILILQGVLWIMKGTFSVALGIAREGAEGLTDAQRLTPLSAWHKVFGYLFGLPILETALVAALLPWTAASVILGKIPLVIVFRVHLLLITAAVLHHAIGLVTGTVIKQKIVAGTVSQLLVIFLHLIVPLFSRLGAGPLGRLGVETAIASEMEPLFTKRHEFLPSTVHFFDWDLSLTGYQWVVMTMLMGFLLLILWRRWKRADAHLFSKPLAVGFFTWVMVMSLGELNPILQSGKLFELADRMTQNWNLPGGALTPEASEKAMAIVWAGAIGCLALIAAMLVATIITPTLDQHWCALRAMRNRRAQRLSIISDAHSATLWIFIIGLIAVAGWYDLVKQVLSGTILTIIFRPDPATPYLLGAGLMLPLLAWGLFMEWRGMKAAFGAAFFFWIVPMMTAIVAALSGVSASGWPKWLMSFSGLTLPAMSLLQSSRGLSGVGGIFHELRTPWIASLVVHGCAVVWFWLCLQKAQKRGAEMPGEERAGGKEPSWAQTSLTAPGAIPEHGG